LRQGEVLEGSVPPSSNPNLQPGSLVCTASLNGRYLPTQIASMTPLQEGSENDTHKVVQVTLEISMEDVKDPPPHLLVLDLWNGRAVTAPSCPVVLLPPCMSHQLDELVSLLERS